MRVNAVFILGLGMRCCSSAEVAASAKPGNKNILKKETPVVHNAFPFALDAEDEGSSPSFVNTCFSFIYSMARKVDRDKGGVSILDSLMPGLCRTSERVQKDDCVFWTGELKTILERKRGNKAKGFVSASEWTADVERGPRKYSDWCDAVADKVSPPSPSSSSSSSSSSVSSGQELQKLPNLAAPKKSHTDVSPTKAFLGSKSSKAVTEPTHVTSTKMAATTGKGPEPASAKETTGAAKRATELKTATKSVAKSAKPVEPKSVKPEVREASNCICVHREDKKVCHCNTDEPSKA